MKIFNKTVIKKMEYWLAAVGKRLAEPEGGVQNDGSFKSSPSFINEKIAHMPRGISSLKNEVREGRSRLDSDRLGWRSYCRTRN